MEAGLLDRDRFNSYLKLKKELAYLSRKVDQNTALAEKAKWKRIHQMQKALKHR